ncbi:hypothetical protein Tco_0215263 [Tanacetum coccineum]
MRLKFNSQKNGGSNNSDSGNVIGSGNQDSGNGGVKNSQLDQNINDSGVAAHIDHNSQTSQIMDGSYVSIYANVIVSPIDPKISNPVLSRPTSYVKLVTGEPSRKSVNFRTLLASVGNGADVAILFSERYANTAYGFFLGKWVSYPVVENYVKNTWSKYELDKSMLYNELFFFKFSSIDGMDEMLENGPCEDGLSIIATKIGTLMMIDSYASDMCMQSWGRLSYARVMIKLRANIELKDTLMPFDALNYVENDDDLGMDGGILKAAGKGSLNVARSSCSTTPIVEKINKLEQQILKGKFMFVEDDGKPLYKVDSIGIADSDSEVEEVFNEIEGYLASASLKSGNGSGYGTNSLLEQWRETKRDDDYDPHDVDLY